MLDALYAAVIVMCTFIPQDHIKLCKDVTMTIDFYNRPIMRPDQCLLVLDQMRMQSIPHDFMPESMACNLIEKDKV
jgi:hypothetical protein